MSLLEVLGHGDVKVNVRCVERPIESAKCEVKERDASEVLDISDLFPMEASNMYRHLCTNCEQNSNGSRSAASSQHVRCGVAALWLRGLESLGSVFSWGLVFLGAPATHSWRCPWRW